MAAPLSVRASWSAEELATLQRLHAQGESNAAISRVLGRSIPGVNNKLSSMRNLIPVRTPAQYRKIHGWDDHSQDEQYFDEPKAQAEREAIAKEFRGQEVRALVLADLHGMFRHHDVLAAADRAITELKLNVLICPGDVLDQYCASRFTKYKHVSMESEVAEMAKVLQHFSRRVKRVVITQGNHDMRAARLIAEKAPQLTPLLKNATNFLGQVANGLTNVTAMDSWWVQIGGAVFCHREKYTKQERTTGESNLRYFENRGVKNIELIVQAHVHRACLIPLKRGTWYLEAPMASYRAEYTYESRSLDAVLTAGYAVVSIDKGGHVDINRTRPYFVSWE